MKHEESMRATRAPRIAGMAMVSLLAAGLTALQGAAPVAALTAAEQHRADFLNISATAPVMVVSHTATWREAPEDSLQGLQRSIDLGVAVAEIDVRKTSDGQLVLMHDESVDRTTNGSGAVSSKTLAQIQDLRLKELRGGANAAVTTYQVPTLAKIFALGKGKILFNIDKAWDLREQVYTEAVAAGVIDQVIFKSDKPVADVNAFLSAHSDALYCHVITDSNYTVAHTFVREPNCYEVVWDSTSDAQIQPTYIAGLNAVSRVFMNTLWRGLAGNYTDEASLINPANGWAGAVSHGADMLQTDDPAALKHWIAGGNPVNYDKPATSVRIQAEDFATGGEGVGYHDLEATNQGGQYRTSEGVDICDLQGNIHVCWIRGGEWLKYSVTLPTAGAYTIRGRVASPYAAPTGNFTLEFSGWTSSAINVRNTTGHQYFLNQSFVASHSFPAGTQTFYLRVDSTAFQNFNIDWIQFDKI